MEKANLPICRSLFVTRDGEALQFYIRPCAEKLKLRPLIEPRGGIMRNAPHESVYSLVDKNAKISEVSDRHVKTQFIYDCVNANKLFPIEKYKLLAQKQFDPEDCLDIDGAGYSDDDICLVRTTARNIRARKEYNRSDDKKILHYVIKSNGANSVKGRSFWTCMEEKQVIADRTWQSLKERYIKKIIPNLADYHLPMEVYKRLKVGCGQWTREDHVKYEKQRKFGKIANRPISSSDDSDADHRNRVTERRTDNATTSRYTAIPVKEVQVPLCTSSGEKTVQPEKITLDSKKTNSPTRQLDKAKIIERSKPFLETPRTKRLKQLPSNESKYFKQQDDNKETDEVSAECSIEEDILQEPKIPQSPSIETTLELKKMRTILGGKLQSPVHNTQESMEQSPTRFPIDKSKADIVSRQSPEADTRVTPSKEDIKRIRSDLNDKLKLPSIAEIMSRDDDVHVDEDFADEHSNSQSLLANTRSLRSTRQTPSPKKCHVLNQSQTSEFQRPTPSPTKSPVLNQSQTSEFQTCKSVESQESDPDSLDERIMETAKPSFTQVDMLRQLRAKMKDKLEDGNSQATPQGDSPSSRLVFLDDSLSALPLIRSLPNSQDSTSFPDKSQSSRKSPQPYAKKSLEKRYKRLTREILVQSAQAMNNRENCPREIEMPPLAERNANVENNASANRSIFHMGIETMGDFVEVLVELYTCERKFVFADEKMCLIPKKDLTLLNDYMKTMKDIS